MFQSVLIVLKFFYMLSKAIALASKAFIGRKDKAGKPYILHCLRVMFSVDQKDEELMQIAVLHDLLEDCPEYHDLVLYKMGFSKRVVTTIEVLTHDKSVSYEDYIKKIALTGVNRISIGSLTKNIKAIDLSMKIETFKSL